MNPGSGCVYGLLKVMKKQHTMKLITYFFTLLCTLAVFAIERPEEVPSKITELRSRSWYQELSNEWKNYLESNPTDQSGWIDYFKAVAFAGKDQSVLNAIAANVNERFEGSFTSYYVGFLNQGWNEEGISMLNKALAIDKSRIVSLEDQLILAELRGNMDRKMLSQAVYDAGLIHSSTLNYNYNLLMSVSEGGLLITDGLHTTVPIWVLQDVMNVRTDVIILNTELSRANLDYMVRTLMKRNIKGSLEDLMAVEQGEGIYYALTMPRQRLEKLENRLYVVGLASTTGSSDFNHFEVLKENIEEKFLMDYLTIDFNGEPKTATGNMLSSNYIVPLLLLKEFYDNVGNTERSDSLEEQILMLAEDSQIRTRVELLLNRDKAPRTFKIVEIDVKKVDKHMKQIRNELYASEVELSNREYWEYMEYLRVNGYTELYEKGKADLSGYDDVTRAWLNNYQYSPANVKALEAKRRGGDYLDYPVLDISQEAAKAFCEWLTVQYNAQEKREFKKVLFRLPTKEEWTIAALGYREFQSWNLRENAIKAKAREGKNQDMATYDLSDYSVDYPWGLMAWNLRNSIKNERDCYLANIKVQDEVVCAAGIKGDGFTLTSPIASYFANGFGLYDVVGNIAEMVQQEGLAMGGSWNHTAEESTITSEYLYDGSDIRVGFRLFMEVIEE